MTFARGHALIIGVGRYRHISAADVPVASEDAGAVSELLQDQARCGYRAENVTLLRDLQADRESVLTALRALSERTTASDTIFFFYVGHGGYGTDGQYYLSTHDTELSNGRFVAGTGLSERALLDYARKLPVRRLLLIINSCHSGNISPSLSAAEVDTTFQSEPLPQQATEALLSTGEGRIVITASRPEQKSWIGSGKLSIFTQALLDGLRGRGYVMNQNGYISAYSLYEHLYLAVSEAATRLGLTQEPELTVLKGVGPFPVALYRGATVTGEIEGSAAPPGGMAAREVSAAQSRMLFDRYVQLIEGSYIAGDVHVSGGDFVGRDKIVRKKKRRKS